MAIGRGSMTKELTGNRVKKMAEGGIAMFRPAAATVKKGGKVAKMAKGGSMRGCGCATKGTKGGKMV